MGIDPIVTRGFLVLSCLAALAARPGCLPTRRPPDPERAILERQVQELERLVAAGRRGPLVPLDQGLVVVDQKLLQALLDAALPYESVVGGNYRIRVLDAEVTAEDGLALFHLSGRASFADRPEKDTFVDADVYGTLREFGTGREDSVLRGRVEVIAFEMSRAAVFGAEDPSVRDLLRDLAQLRLEAFQGLDYAFDIPVRIPRDFVLPEVETKAGVRIPATRIPLQGAVTGVRALGGKLWISLHLIDLPIPGRRR